MRRIITNLMVVVPLLVFGGCSSQPTLVTRTYKLPQGDISWQAISMVLDDQWQQHDVFPQHAHREDDAAVVRTSASGHQKIRAAISPR